MRIKNVLAEFLLFGLIIFALGLGVLFFFYFYILLYIILPLGIGEPIMVYPLMWGAVSSILIWIGMLGEKQPIEDIAFLNYLGGLVFPWGIIIGHPVWALGLIVMAGFIGWKLTCILRKYEDLEKKISRITEARTLKSI